MSHSHNATVIPRGVLIGAATLVFGCRVEIDCVAVVPA